MTSWNELYFKLKMELENLVNNLLQDLNLSIDTDFTHFEAILWEEIPENLFYITEVESDILQKFL